METWQPRPDPGREGSRLGMRAHAHPVNQFHYWVFDQHQVWVDFWGNEHEIESMPINYVENVIAFCEERAEAIFNHVTALEVLMLYREGQRDEARDLLLLMPEADAVEWLNETPVFVALRRRLDQAR